MRYICPKKCGYATDNHGKWMAHFCGPWPLPPAGKPFKMMDTPFEMDLEATVRKWQSTPGAVVHPDLAKAVGRIEMIEPPSALAHQEGGGHYKDLKIQPIEFIHANGIGYMEGNVVKYIVRHGSKGKEEDVRKALHYCQLILQLQYGVDK